MANLYYITTHIYMHTRTHTTLMYTHHMYYNNYVQLEMTDISCMVTLDMPHMYDVYGYIQCHYNYDTYGRIRACYAAKQP